MLLFLDHPDQSHFHHRSPWEYPTPTPTPANRTVKFAWQTSSSPAVLRFLVKERADFFVEFSSANSFYTLEVIGALEGTCLDNALCDNGADSRNVFKFR